MSILTQLEQRLLQALERVLPYAESRAEDLSAFKEQGLEDPEFPGADEAWKAINDARLLLGKEAVTHG